MVKVKICGIRRQEDIEYVNAHMPDYIGFIFAKSKREISPLQAGMLASNLNKSIKKVGVFVNEDISKIIETAGECRLDVVQVHGDETPEYILNLKSKLKMEVWKAVRVKDEKSLERLKDYEADKFVLDAYNESSYGGAGKVFDWNLAVEAKKYGDIILAGGLDPQNIKEAVSIVQPCIVDVSSGVETDGWKDGGKIKDFIYSVRYNMY